MDLLNAFLGVFSLGTWYVSAFIIWCVLVEMGTYQDVTYHKPGGKWAWFIIGMLVLMIGSYWKSDLSIGTYCSKSLTWNFWTPIVEYLILGLIYAVVEFFIELNRCVNSMKKRWADFLQTDRKIPEELARSGDGMNQEMSEILARAKGLNFYTSAFCNVRGYVKDYIGSMESERSLTIVKLSLGPDSLTPEPSINRSALIDHISAWTILWPFYFLNSIVEDLISNLWSILATFLMDLGNRFIKFKFRDIFIV